MLVQVMQEKRASHNVMLARQVLSQNVNLCESDLRAFPLSPGSGHFQCDGTAIDAEDINMDTRLLRTLPDFQGNVAASRSQIENADPPSQSPG